MCFVRLNRTRTCFTVPAHCFFFSFLFNYFWRFCFTLCSVQFFLPVTACSSYVFFLFQSISNGNGNFVRSHEMKQILNSFTIPKQKTNHCYERKKKKHRDQNWACRTKAKKNACQIFEWIESYGFLIDLPWLKALRRRQQPTGNTFFFSRNSIQLSLAFTHCVRSISATLINRNASLVGCSLCTTMWTHKPSSDYSFWRVIKN